MHLQLERVELELDNIRAALEWFLASEDSDRAQRLAAVMTRFWGLCGRAREGKAWLDRVLAMPSDPEPSAARAQALVASFSMLKEECDYVTGWPLGQQAVAISRTTADKRELAFALNELGQIARFHGQYTDAGAIHAEARDLYQELGDDLWAAFSIDAIAWTAMDQQSLDEAVHLHQVAQRAWPKIGPRLPGWVHFLQGRCDAARAAHQSALEAYRERGDGGGTLWVLADLGFIDLRQGDVISAGRHFCEVLQRAEQRGYRMHIARALHGVSRMAALRSEHALARSLAEAEWNLRSSFGIAVPPSERVALQRTDPESTAVAHTSLDSAVLAAFDFLTRLTQRPDDRTRQEPGAADLLTPRELEVLQLLAQGKTNREIADTLEVSPKTAAHHIENIFSKLQVTTRLAAVNTAHRNGWC